MKTNTSLSRNSRVSVVARDGFVIYTGTVNSVLSDPDGGVWYRVESAQDGTESTEPAACVVPA